LTGDLGKLPNTERPNKTSVTNKPQPQLQVVGGNSGNGGGDLDDDLSTFE